MTGANHDRVPGSDSPPLIGVEHTPTGWRLRVLDWQGWLMGSLWCADEDAARKAEGDLRTLLARAHDGDVKAVLREFFDERTDLPAWWEGGEEARG